MIVSLIIPPSPFLGDQKRNAPLGILYIAAWLEQHEHIVYISDLRNIKPAGWSHNIQYGEIYGITATTPEYPYAIAIAKTIRNSMQHSIVILGGAHVTARPNDIDPIFDKLILGEGELGILEMIDDLSKGIEKSIYPCKRRMMHLDNIPFPARHLLSRESFISYTNVVRGEASTTITGSRGCAYNCSFCASKVIWGRQVKFRSPQNVVAEIKELMEKYGITHFRFQDDTIAINKKWILELCKKIEPLGITWRGTTRVDHSQEDILQVMKKAGCIELGYGIETLGDNILKMHHKQITNKEIYSAIYTARKVGIKTRLFFMIGLPGQDINIADDIIAFIDECKPDGVNLSTFVPYPGLDIYENPDKYGIEINEHNWTKFVITKGLYGEEADDPFIYKHDKLTDEQLRSMRKKLLTYFAEHNLTHNK